MTVPQRVAAIIPARAGSQGLPSKSRAQLDGLPLLAWTVLPAQATGRFDDIIIPARAGSQGLPSKSRAQLDGLPLLAWTVLPAQATGRFDDIIVTSDDAGTLALARDLGATPLPRPTELAGDRASLEDVAEHAIDWLAARDRAPATVAMLLPTYPLRTRHDVNRALDQPGIMFAARDVSVRLRDMLIADEHSGKLEPLFVANIDAADRAVPLCSYILTWRVGARRHVPAIARARHPLSVIDIDTPADLALAQVVLDRGLFVPDYAIPAPARPRRVPIHPVLYHTFDAERRRATPVPVPGRWHLDAKSDGAQLIDAATGKPLLHRQQYPPVWFLDRAIDVRDECD